MVNIEVYGSNGKMIPYEKISAIPVPCKGFNDNLIKLLIHETFYDISEKEWITLMRLFAKAIDYGGEVEEIRNYIELFDKIEKIVKRNDCK